MKNDRSNTNILKRYQVTKTASQKHCQTNLCRCILYLYTRTTKFNNMDVVTKKQKCQHCHTWDNVGVHNNVYEWSCRTCAICPMVNVNVPTAEHVNAQPSKFEYWCKNYAGKLVHILTNGVAKTYHITLSIVTNTIASSWW